MSFQFGHFFWATLTQRSIYISPENVRKPLAFWHFQEVENWGLDQNELMVMKVFHKYIDDLKFSERFQNQNDCSISVKSK